VGIGRLQVGAIAARRRKGKATRGETWNYRQSPLTFGPHVNLGLILQKGFPVIKTRPTENEEN
jgi:hypothetical protein